MWSLISNRQPGQCINGDALHSARLFFQAEPIPRVTSHVLNLELCIGISTWFLRWNIFRCEI